MRVSGVIMGILLLTCSACESQTKPKNTNPGDAAAKSAVNQSEPAPAAAVTPAQTKSKTASPAVSTSANSSLAAPEQSGANPILEQKLLTKEQIEEGWISLFDGQTLFGWHSSNKEIRWKVEEGAITADVGPVGLLLTSVPFADFELVCEFRIAAGGNSGLFLRTIADPQDLTQDCFELNIADEQPEGYLTGSLVNRQKTEQPIKGSGVWQTFHVIAQGSHFQVKLNGKSILDYTDQSKNPRLAGMIGLQQRFGKVQFRKLNLKPLGLKSLFNGKDLSGWRVVPGSKSQFTVQKGEIHVENGAGFLETEKNFKNFVFQASAKTNARELNSGFFFRAEPGTEKAPSNGYELQIHNGITDGNRNKPNNAGTGAIFRRVEARRVVADDLQWFTTTLVASGPQFAIWVDGYPEVDWQDQRKPDPNPRKGQRLDAGHISLQGHDPTTNVDFRELRIEELPDDSQSAAPYFGDSKSSDGN